MPMEPADAPHVGPREQHDGGMADSLPLDERLRLREDFFRHTGIDPRQFLQAFDHVPGLFYFVKDAQSRTLINTREYAQLPERESEDAIIGKRPGEYLAKELADHYEADDRR